jgi:hypothetical protein
LSVQQISAPKKIHPHRWLKQLIEHERQSRNVVVLRFATSPGSALEGNSNLDLALREAESFTLYGPACDSQWGCKVAYAIPTAVDVTVYYKPKQWKRYANCSIAMVQDPAKTWQINIRGDGSMERINLERVQYTIKRRSTEPIIKATRIVS